MVPFLRQIIFKNYFLKIRFNVILMSIPKFSGVKNPKHAFLRKGSKAVGPVS
jgi:hypothetical protein